MKDVFVGIPRVLANVAAALAAGAIASGDTVHVDKGTYTDVPALFKNLTDLTIQVDGYTVLRDAAGVPIGLQDHAIYECVPAPHTNAGGATVMISQLAGNGGIFAFALTTARITVKGIEFRGAKLGGPDYNGAGIRFQGKGLIHQDCWFHDNDMGVLTGDQLTSDGKLDGYVLGIGPIFHDNGSPAPGHNSYYGPAKYLINTDGSSHDAHSGGHNEKFHQGGGMAISYRMAHPNTDLSAASSDIDANTGDTLIAGFSGVKPARPKDANGVFLAGYSDTNYARQISVNTNRDASVPMNNFALVDSVLQSPIQNVGSAVSVQNTDSKVDPDTVPENIDGLIEDCVFLNQPALNAKGAPTNASWAAHPINAAAGVTIGGNNQMLPIGAEWTAAPPIMPAEFHLTLETLPAFLAAVVARYPNGPDWPARYAALEAGLTAAVTVAAPAPGPAPAPVPAPAPAPAPVPAAAVMTRITRVPGYADVVETFPLTAAPPAG